MLECSKCHEEKDDDEFRRNKTSNSGRDHYCRQCRKIYMDDWKRENRERYLAMRKRYRDRYKALWMEILHEFYDEIKCHRCGWDEEVSILEWHHTEPGKEEQPNRIFARRPSPERFAEIASCEPTCPSCHRILHMGGNKPKDEDLL